jgi:GNAT superfamily N-acetyltransferase
MTIRAAIASDAAAIAILAGELGYPATAEEMRVRMSVLSPTDTVFVYDDEGEVVAWIQVTLSSSLESGPFAEIRGLIVAGTHRSRRLGEQLVAVAEDWARAQGAPRMRVRSNVLRERTHAFYERLGYHVTKSQKVFDKGLRDED